MAVRFKFRSSPAFDSVPIGDQPFISIRDLKSEIVKLKHLNLSQDFDLVFSDSQSGLEYQDEDFRIPSGSSVIIKRVPAKSSPSHRAIDTNVGCGGREANHVIAVEPPPMKSGASVFNDFGVDLCPLPAANTPELGKLQSDSSEKEDYMFSRASEEPLVRCAKLDVTHPNQSSAKGSSANEGSTLVMQSKPKKEEQMQLGRTFPVYHSSMERSDLPSELKCSLCRNFFRDAVMIPCCQHSFCKNCICLSLAKNTKCPMCSSTKCREEDLLPNVSLRQAIERFLESQLLPNGSENGLNRYAPDGESGIQVRELSYSATVTQRDLKLNRSATGKRYLIMKNKRNDSAHLADMNCKRSAFAESTEFEGENDPQSSVRADEEASCTKNEDVFHMTGGGGRPSTVPGRQKWVQRTCYMCGSPDHLIRDCPVAASSRTNYGNGDASLAGPVPGCSPAYWPGNPPHVRPSMHMYGGPVMVYNTTMPPVMPYAFSSYTPSMYPAYPVPSACFNMGVGCMAPPTGNNGSQLIHADWEKNYNGDFGRERIHQDGQIFNMQRDNMERRVNHSDESLARRLEGKHKSYIHSDDDTYSNSERCRRVSRKDGRRDVKISRSGISTSEKDRHAEKHERWSRNSDERREFDSDPRREIIKRRRTEHDERYSDREFHSHSRSSMEQSSRENVRRRREEYSHERRPSKEFHHHREKTSKYSENEYGESYHGHKRKRF